MKLLGPAIALAAVVTALSCTPTAAKELVYSGKLLLTGGVTNVEGVGGAGLTNWATITGYGADNGWGGNVHATEVELPDYKLHAYGVGVGLFDRLEVSYTRQNFDTGSTGGKLGLGNGFTFNQDIIGAKLRIAGDPVYDEKVWMPEISVGAEYKHADRGAIIHAVGGKSDTGTDYYVAATKVLLAQSLVLDGTVRMTKANQFGLLGFGGDKSDGYSAQFEGSAAYLVTKHLAIGADYRTKPDNLGFAKEDDAWDLFAAYALNKHLSVTAAYVDLGSIATFKGQHGAYLSLQAGF